MIRNGVVWGWLLLMGSTTGCARVGESQSPLSAPTETETAPAAVETRTTAIDQAKDSTSKPDDVAPVKAVKPVELIDANWDELQGLIAEQQGKIVVVDIWSTACEPCMTEFPHLISLQQRFPDDVVAISFDVDYAGIKNKPPAYYRERVLNFLGSQVENQVLHRMCTTAAEELFDAIKLDSIPAVYVYGRDGQLLKRFTGSTAESEGVSYEKQVLPYVGDQIK